MSDASRRDDPWPVAVAAESPLQDEVRRLVAALNADLLELTPREFCHHMTVEEMAGPDTTAFVARIGGEAVAIGALRRHGEGVGEVKRMYTRPDTRGRGVAGQVLSAIEQLAGSEGLRRLVLETGNRHLSAWRLYERFGFRRCGPFLGYPDTGWSIFYEKQLATVTA
ncbi:MAG TPA: GNAT family N-acetyltransferase [Bauldia sp.]|nr:GNAT family N-acetyltransferase [Bauldia sp.]